MQSSRLRVIPRRAPTRTRLSVSPRLTPTSFNLAHVWRRLTTAISSLLQRVFQRKPAPIDASQSAAVLIAVRKEIDQIDRRLFALLNERTRLGERARAAKAQLGRGIVDLAREQVMFKERRAWALEHDLDAEGVTKMYEAIVLVSRRAQERSSGKANPRRKARGR